MVIVVSFSNPLRIGVDSLEAETFYTAGRGIDLENQSAFLLFTFEMKNDKYLGLVNF